MAYTPINWQTGETITAEKMNKMDNGFAVTRGTTTYFDGSVTVPNGSSPVSLSDVTGDFSSASEITATLDSVAYNLTGFDDDGFWTFGAPYGDFSTYTFSISFGSGAAVPDFIAEEAGTYALKIEAAGMAIETSSDFEAAVNSVVDLGLQPLQCVDGVTSIDDANAAKDSGRLLYFWTQSHGCYLISTIGMSCTIVPESNAVTAGFNRDGIFYITES